LCLGAGSNFLLTVLHRHRSGEHALGADQVSDVHELGIVDAAAIGHDRQRGAVTVHARRRGGHERDKTRFDIVGLSSRLAPRCMSAAKNARTTRDSPLRARYCPDRVGIIAVEAGRAGWYGRAIGIPFMMALRLTGWPARTGQTASPASVPGMGAALRRACFRSTATPLRREDRFSGSIATTLDRVQGFESFEVRLGAAQLRAEFGRHHLAQAVESKAVQESGDHLGESVARNALEEVGAGGFSEKFVQHQIADELLLLGRPIPGGKQVLPLQRFRGIMVSTIMMMVAVSTTSITIHLTDRLGHVDRRVQFGLDSQRSHRRTVLRRPLVFISLGGIFGHVRRRAGADGFNLGFGWRFALRLRNGCGDRGRKKPSRRLRRARRLRHELARASWARLADKGRSAANPNSTSC